VIIVTFNTRELTVAAVESVFGSTDGTRKEVIVVDNGSQDDTRSAVSRKFPQVKYHYSERNLGFARANNVGANLASGEWILLLNSDARLKADSLRLALNYLRDHPDCGVLGAQLLNADGSRQNSIANFPSLATELLNQSMLRRLFPNRYPGKEHRLQQPTTVDSVIGAFLLTPRHVWDAVAGLDERFFFFLEETDYCRQVKERDYAVVHHPGVEVWHDQGGSANRVRVQARIEYWRSRYLYFQKHHSLGQQRMLRWGLMVRLGLGWSLNGTATVVTLGRSRPFRQRFAIDHALLIWHLAGRPQSSGLPR
jgi:GT2 family glycosyltransferase